MSYKPNDCAAPCKYPAVTLPTGSGHLAECPSHQRWLAQGRTWRPPSEADRLRFTAEAAELLDQLGPLTAAMEAREEDFVLDMVDRFDKYGERTYVSQSQIDWLRRLAEEYR